MCNLFASQDPASYACETRAIRLSGHATSLRLECAFWAILERIAAEEGTSVGRFVSTLYDEVMQRQGDVPNLASLLRVSCAHWLARGADAGRFAPASFAREEYAAM